MFVMEQKLREKISVVGERAKLVQEAGLKSIAIELASVTIGPIKL